MEKTAKTDELRTLLEPIVENRGAFLVDVAVRGEGRRQLLEVFCETEKGITIDECAGISREVLPVVESSGILGDAFRLDVSSPGVGAPLKDKRQYVRNVGRIVAVKYRDGDEVREVEGDLVGMAGDKITLRTGTASLELGLDSIVEARVKIRW